MPVTYKGKCDMSNGTQKPPQSQHYEKVMAQYDDALGLSKETFFGFAIVSGIFSRTLQPDEIEKQFAADFIAKTINDPDFNGQVNHAIDKILNQRSEYDPLFNAAMQMLEIIFHTRRLHHFKSIIERMSANHETVIRGGSVQEGQKLSLSEYGLVRDLGALQPIINELKEIQSLDSVSQLHAAINKCNRTIRDIELKIKIDQSKHPFFPIQKQHPFYEKLLNYFAHLSVIFVQSKITPPTHGMQP